MFGIALLLAAVAVASAEEAEPLYSTSDCVYPEICRPPPSKFSQVIPIRPRMQWNTNGGFCGALSVQVMAMSYGAWISQDLIRKANRGGPCFGHTSLAKNGTSGEEGCEVGPDNYAVTARGLKLAFDVWDYRQPAPQASAWKRWMKSHLAKGEPVMWVPMEKGNSHTPYGPRSCPGGGHFDHHEPIIGIGSNHDLSDATVYDDDWIVHFSDYDLQPCYRKINSLDDDFNMEGNCGAARKDKRQMFPCFFRDVTYGMSITGLQLKVPSLRVFLDVDTPYEPNVRLSESPTILHGTVRVQGLRPGLRYALYRFNGTAALPESSNFEGFYERKIPFVAEGETWTYEDPQSFLSSAAVYYVAVPEAATSFAELREASEQSAGEKLSSSSASWWLERAPTWPSLVRAGVRTFMDSSGYQGGSRFEALASVFRQSPSLLAGFAVLASAASAGFVVGGTASAWRRWAGRSEIVERPLLG